MTTPEAKTLDADATPEEAVGPGRPFDAEVRDLSLELRQEILDAGLSFAEVGRAAGYISASDYHRMTQTLRGEKASRPVYDRLRSVFDKMRGISYDRLTQRETAEVSS